MAQLWYVIKIPPLKRRSLADLALIKALRQNEKFRLVRHIGLAPILSSIIPPIMIIS